MNMFGLGAPLVDVPDEDLVELARTGEDRAIDVLLNRYRSFARVKARTYFLAGADREDIVQEGMIGLYKAIRDYRSDRSSAFRGFADLCITRQIITAIKSATRQKHAPLNSYVSLNRSLADDEVESAPFEETIVGSEISDPAELVVSAEALERIRSSMGEVLSSFEIDVLRLYMDGKTYLEIADILGRHVKSIDNALQRIKKKLEEHLDRSSRGTG